MITSCEEQFTGILGKLFAIDGLVFDEEGKIELLIDDRMPILVERNDENRAFMLIGHLADSDTLEVPKHVWQEMLMQNMNMNDGAVKMAIVPVAKDLILFQQFKYEDLNLEEEIMDRCSNFIQEMDLWTDILQMASTEA